MELKEVEGVLKQYGHEESAILAILQDVQDSDHYLDGRSYNLHGAIAECLEQLAMDQNKARQWSRGAVRYNHYDLMEMARHHRSLAGARGTTIVRTYRH